MEKVWRDVAYWRLSQKIKKTIKKTIHKKFKKNPAFVETIEKNHSNEGLKQKVKNVNLQKSSEIETLQVRQTSLKTELEAAKPKNDFLEKTLEKHLKRKFFI